MTKKKSKDKLMSIAEYAKACGGTRAAIYLRIKNKKIKTTTQYNGEYTAQVIDTSIYPVKPIKHGRQPFKV